MSGQVKKLPYPDACRVLEKMFEGWTADELFDVIDERADNGQTGISRRLSG